MADTVTNQTIQDYNKSDGTGESSVKKVDVSALATDSDGTRAQLLLSQESTGRAEVWALTSSSMRQLTY